MHRTPGSAGNRTTWTWSGWVKRTNITTLQCIYAAGTGGGARGLLEFQADDTIRFGFNDGSSWYLANTNSVFRDSGAWYHIVVALDLGNGTNANRVKLYVNNVQQTFASTPTWPTTGQVFNNNVQHIIGSYYGPPGSTYDGYITEVHMVDGTTLTPSSFGETNATTGIWQPKLVTGLTYGTTGYYLSYADNTSTTTLGNDDAGGAAGSGAGSNDWTLVNFSVTAGEGNDSLTDTPTNNYCTISTIAVANQAYTNVVSNGGLQIYATTYGSTNQRAHGTNFSVNTGKWYWETTLVTVAGTGNSAIAGWSKDNISNATAVFTSTRTIIGGNFGYTTNTATSKYADSGTATTITSASSQGGDIITVAIDFDAGKAWLGKNGSWWNASNSLTTFDTNSPTITFTPTGSFYMPIFEPVGAGTNTNRSGFIANFGQRAFAYTPPTGFLSVCSSNLSTPAIVDPTDYFNVKLYTGTGSSNALTGVGHQPDLVWIKGRSGATDHVITDAVRGVTKELKANTTGTEATSVNGLTAFGSDGFTVGTAGDYNTNTATYAAWCWKESVTSGMDIVSYTGTGSSQSVSHSLGTSPQLILIKARTAAAENWFVYHRSLTGVTYFVRLNANNAQADGTTGRLTAVSSSTFTVGTNSEVNSSGQTYIAYVFAEVPGFSRFGSYTGNGSADGPFVWCGFRPKFVLMKRTDTTGHWYLVDSARDPLNVVKQEVYPSLSSAEAASTSTIDILSNGFKLRISDAPVNGSAGSFVFIAFAEAPFKYALAR